MKFDAVLGAVLATFGKYLKTRPAAIGINVNLAVLAIQLRLDAHSASTHIKTVLDAPSLEPKLPRHFDAQLRLNVVQDPLSCTTLVAGNEPKFCFLLLQGLQRGCEVLPNCHDIGQSRVTLSIEKMGV